MEPTKHSYTTLSEAINDLKKRGYNRDFNLRSNCIECNSSGGKFVADEFEIDEVHRFEGDSNPDDNSILYAISSSPHNLKGTLVDAYGVYSDPMNEEMIKKLHYKE